MSLCKVKNKETGTKYVVLHFFEESKQGAGVIIAEINSGEILAVKISDFGEEYVFDGIYG